MIRPLLDPRIAYIHSGQDPPENLSDIPEGLEEAVCIAHGDQVYLRVGTQFKGVEVQSFYPGRIEDVDGVMCMKALVTLPGFQRHSRIPMTDLAGKEFYKHIE